MVVWWWTGGGGGGDKKLKEVNTERERERVVGMISHVRGRLLKESDKTLGVLS